MFLIKNYLIRRWQLIDLVNKKTTLNDFETEKKRKKKVRNKKKLKLFILFNFFVNTQGRGMTLYSEQISLRSRIQGAPIHDKNHT